MQLSVDYNEIVKKLDEINPIQYGKSRNFIDGAVTQLSPYISRGILDTKMILTHLVNKGYTYYQCEKFIQQLMWREYFQRVWQTKGTSINKDIKQQQQNVSNHGIPLSIDKAQTSIDAIDIGIQVLKSTGMMHNHLRMYVAFIACNLVLSHWFHPAQWMYYHLLDGDWGSNALSWQWVAGTFSNKKYIANQENINYYTKSNQQHSFIDVPYDILQNMSMPDQLKEITSLQLNTNLPVHQSLCIDPTIPTLIYNYYNLSPTWRTDINANRILLLEPEIFKNYPVSDQCISFMIDLSKNIKDIQIFNGSFEELKSKTSNSTIFYREHPLNEHYQGNEDPRPWILPDAEQATGSFFSFWKKNEHKIRKQFNQ